VYISCVLGLRPFALIYELILLIKKEEEKKKSELLSLSGTYL
jgi:hypothetical protein